MHFWKIIATAAVTIGIAAVVFLFVSRPEKTMKPEEKTRSPSELVADVFAALPQDLDSSRIRTAAQYRVLIHLLRPLTQYDRNAKIEANLAERWEVEDDFKLYRFHLSMGAKWSNGEPVTATDVKKSIDRQVKLGTGTHFVFSDIKEVRAKDPSVVEILLKNRSPHFLRAVAHPEFGPTRLAGDKEDFSVTSGPYLLESASMDELVLRKNENFSGAHPNSAERVRIQSSPVETQIHKLRQSKVQFVAPSGLISQEMHVGLSSDASLKTFVPHVGYSYWLSINPDSPTMKARENRLWLSTAVNSAKLEIPSGSQLWQRAHQLVLPDSSGRIPEAELDALWKQAAAKRAANAPKEIRLLTSETFRWNKDIVSLLEKLGAEVKVTTYKSAAEVEEHTKKRDFDAMLINNDFSGAHMLQSLTVTLNPSRPLVFTDHHPKISQALRRAMDSPEIDLTFEASKQISSALISEGLIAPLVYNRKAYYASQALDLSRLSPLQSDLCFWKIGLK